MSDHAELKIELEAIAKLLEKLPESVKPQAFDLLVNSFLGRELIATTTPENQETLQKPAKKNGKGAAKRSVKKSASPTESAANGATKTTNSRPKSGKESYSINGNLNLRGNGGSIPSFRDFHTEKNPGTVQEFNTVAVYYLEKIAGIKPISLNDVYTCYSDVRRKPPIAFRQSFTDTKNKTAHIEFADSIPSMTHRGQTFVEHDLPAPVAAKKK